MYVCMYQLSDAAQGFPFLFFWVFLLFQRGMFETRELTVHMCGGLFPDRCACDVCGTFVRLGCLVLLRDGMYCVYEVGMQGFRVTCLRDAREWRVMFVMLVCRMPVQYERKEI